MLSVPPRPPETLSTRLLGARMAEISRLNTADSDFNQRLDALLAWESVSNHQVNEAVSGIVNDVRNRGDAAVLEYTRRFDGVDADAMETLNLPLESLREAFETLPENQRQALETAASRIRAYAERIEFWQGQVGRLHDRFVYRRLPDSGEPWSVRRLGP